MREWLLFAFSAAAFWGAYVPTIFYGQQAFGPGNPNRSMRAFMFIGLAYFIMAWWMVGKDPAEGTIIPQYTPPEGLSPAAMRFIMKLGYDTKVFSASVINLAVKGYLEIAEDGGMFVGRTFTLTQAKTPTGDARQAVEDAINAGDNPTIRSLAVSAGATEPQVRKWVREMQEAGSPITLVSDQITMASFSMAASSIIRSSGSDSPAGLSFAGSASSAAPPFSSSAFSSSAF
jgi:transposase-like protein